MKTILLSEAGRRAGLFAIALKSTGKTIFISSVK